MSNFDALIRDLVIANRILAREEVVDAYGHVSVRHPDNPNGFLIARSVAPELVGPEDIVELDLDAQPVHDEGRSLYLERFIHAAIFAARPDVMAVVHAHAEDTLPFGIARGAKLRPVIHSGSFIGTEVPVWDIADNFGDTNLLVTNMAQASDLAKCLGGNSVALMRGHGFAAAARSLIEVVRLSVYLPRNARALMRAGGSEIVACRAVGLTRSPPTRCGAVTFAGAPFRWGLGVLAAPPLGLPSFYRRHLIAGTSEPGASPFVPVARATEREAAKQTVDLAPIREMFETVRANGYKTPVYRAAGLIISRASDLGKNPGALYVKTEGDEYLGKILGTEYTGKPAPALVAIAADPRGEAIRAEGSVEAGIWSNLR